MLAFSKVQKQKQLKRNFADLATKQQQSQSIILEGSNFSSKSKDICEDKIQQEQQLIDNNTSQEQIKNKKNELRYHQFEEMKQLNLDQMQQQSQKVSIEEDLGNARKNSKNIVWKDLLDLSFNLNGNEVSRIQNRVKTPQWRITRFHGFSQFNQSPEKSNNQNFNFSINNISQLSNQKQSLSPSPPRQDSNTLLHSQHHNKNNHENSIFVRRIQTPNKFSKPQQKHPFSNDKYEKAQFQNEVLQRTTFLLQNKDKSYLPQIKVDKQKREVRQKEIQQKMRQYFVKNHIKLKQENDSFVFDNYTVRGLSVTPQQKQHNFSNQFL